MNWFPGCFLLSMSWLCKTILVWTVGVVLYTRYLSADVALVTSDPNFGMCWMYHNKGNTASNEIVTHKIRATFWTLCLNISYMCGNTILRHLIVLIVARPMLTRKHNMDSQWSCYTNNVCKDGRHRMEVQWLDTMQPLFPRHCENAHCFVMCESNVNAN